MQELFRKVLKNDKLDVAVENLKDESVSAIITLSEQNRRMYEMMRMYGMANKDMLGGDEKLTLNAKHPLVQYVYEHKDNEEDVDIFCEQLYSLAMISNRALSPEEMTGFVTRSNEIMMRLTK